MLQSGSHTYDTSLEVSLMRQIIMFPLTHKDGTYIKICIHTVARTKNALLLIGFTTLVMLGLRTRSKLITQPSNVSKVA
jgi:hypothetical protein